MNPTHKIKLKPKAHEDLDNIYLYSFNNFGKAKAIDCVNDLNQAFIRISKNIASIQTCDYIKPKLQKLIVNSHVFFFNSLENTTEIIRILHQSQDFEKHIND